MNDSKYNSDSNTALLTVPQVCAYLNIGKTKCREIMANPHNGFTVRIGRRLYAHKAQLDKWLERQILK